MRLGCPIVNPDAIRMAIYGQRFWADGEKLVWAHAWVMVRSLFLAGHHRVILDATNTTRKRRDVWSSPHWKTVFKVIGTDPNICLDRARAEKDDAIIPIIEKMVLGYQWLQDGEEKFTE